VIEVKIFGSEPPCSYCKRTEAAAREAAGRFPEGQVTVTKLAANSPEGLAAGFTSTPAVAVNGRVVSEGRVPDADEMESIFRQERGG
jgi:hypothetical protein